MVPSRILLIYRSSGIRHKSLKSHSGIKTLALKAQPMPCFISCDSSSRNSQHEKELPKPYIDVR